MTNPADNPCTCRACGALILNEVVSICPDCEAESDSLAEDIGREADNNAFADACGQMTQEDWDADNDWLASAGWGEM